MDAKPAEEIDKKHIPLTELGGLPPRRPRNPSELAPGTSPTQQPFIPAAASAQSPTTFLCPNCQTSLTTYGGDIPGLCPVCKFCIVEIPVHPQSLLAAAAEPSGESRAVSAPVAPAPESREAAGQIGELTSRRPEQHRIGRTGNYKFRPLGMEDIPNHQPEFEKENPSPNHPEAVSSAPAAARQWGPAVKWTAVAGMICFLIIATSIGMFIRSGEKTAVPPPSEQPVRELRAKLNKGAEECLMAALGSGDPAGIAAHVIGGEQMIPAIEARMKAAKPFPRFSQSDILAPVPMSDEDIRRGLCGLRYQVAPDDTLSLGKPLIPMEITQGGTGFSLLEGAAVIESISKTAPRQALAIFITRNGKPLLDWDLFIQTWDRRLMDFRDGMLGSGPMRFRVILSMDTPIFENGEFLDQTVIRMQDPLHENDIIRVRTDSYDPVVSALAGTALAPEDTRSAMTPQTATVDLVRSEKTGRVTFKRFVCKEFLGLGGRENGSRAHRGGDAHR